MKDGKSSKVIFGSQNADIKGLQSQGIIIAFAFLMLIGWSIETPVEGLAETNAE